MGLEVKNNFIAVNLYDRNQRDGNGPEVLINIKRIIKITPAPDDTTHMTFDEFSNHINHSYQDLKEAIYK